MTKDWSRGDHSHNYIFSYYILHFWVRPLLSFFEFIVKILRVHLFPFPNSVHILITNALTSLSDKLFVSLFFSPGFFSCYFNWMVLPFSCCLTFCLYEFRWSSYLTWSWKGVLTRTVCVHASGGELRWTWMQVTSFRRVLWQVSSWQVVGLEMGLEQRQV